MEETKVSISIEEYKNFIIAQYQQGEIKQTLTDEINSLEKDKKELEESMKEILENKDFILGLAFERNEMRYNSRREQTDYTGYNFAFNKVNKEWLLKIGFIKEELIDYINRQWDEKEKSEATKDFEELAQNL